MPEPNSNSFENNLKRAIEATGLPTEMSATKTLTELGWAVQNEYPYVDRENKRVRTLDIKAVATFRKGYEKPIKDILKESIRCELYIECKKSNKPWIFYLDTMTDAEISFRIERLAGDFTTDTYNTILDFYKQLIENSDTIEEGKLPKSILTEIPAKFQRLSYKIALSHKIIFAKLNEEENTANGRPKAPKTTGEVDKGRDEIYSAEMQIFKALNHQEKQDKLTASPQTKRMVIPIILLNGNMFGCYYDGEKLQTPKIEYTRHLAHGLPNQKVPALIDVVTLSYFSQYLKLIGQEIRNRLS